jgi:hypothetical protein
MGQPGGDKVAGTLKDILEYVRFRGTNFRQASSMGWWALGWKRDREMLEKQLNPPAPRIIGEIELTDLRNAIAQAVKPDSPQFYLVDQKYKLTTKAELAKGLEVVLRKGWSYIPEYRDCDDASFRLNGLFSIGEWSSLAFGIAFGDSHAFNCALTKEENGLQFWVIEPQVKGGKIYSYQEAGSIYKPIWFIMM